MLLQLAVGPYLLKQPTAITEHMLEKDLIRLAWTLGRPLRPKDVTDRYGINFRTARKHLRSLCDKGLLKPKVQGRDIRHYELTADPLEMLG
jgi:predicted ArsR family transcriptional regulator